MSEKKFSDLNDAVTCGILRSIELANESNYSVVGVWDQEDGPVRYSDERINVVTRTFHTFFNPYVDRDPTSSTDMATFGRAVIFALDKFAEENDE